MTRPWLILGSAPSMPRYADDAFLEIITHRGRVSTTNAGIYECMLQSRWPDYYAIIEIATPVYYRRFYEKAIAVYSTQVITCQTTLDNLRTHKREPIPYDFLIDEFDAQYKYWEPGLWSQGPSGSILLQHAINNGAKDVIVLGMDGYKSKPGEEVVDSFDGRHGHKRGEAQTKGQYGGLIRRIIKMSKDVRFRFFGDLRYDIHDSEATGPDDCRVWLNGEPCLHPIEV